MLAPKRPQRDSVTRCLGEAAPPEIFRAVAPPCLRVIRYGESVPGFPVSSPRNPLLPCPLGSFCVGASRTNGFCRFENFLFAASDDVALLVNWPGRNIGSGRDRYFAAFDGLPQL
jgi:hypothetical protein